MRGGGPKEISSHFRKLRRDRASLRVQECGSLISCSWVKGTIAVGWNPTCWPSEGGDVHSEGGQSTRAHVLWAPWGSLLPGILLWKRLSSVAGAHNSRDTEPW